MSATNTREVAGFLVFLANNGVISFDDRYSRIANNAEERDNPLDGYIETAALRVHAGLTVEQKTELFESHPEIFAQLEEWAVSRNG